MLDFPSIVSLTMTYRCNLTCRMCGQWSRNGYFKKMKKSRELPVAAWKRVIHQIPLEKKPVILIRGGEPLLYSGIMELIAYIKKKGLFISMDTNGVLLEKYADRIAESGIDNINVSIDGPETVHDKVRGARGCFRNLAKGISKVREQEKGSNRPSCITTLCFTISPWSYEALPDMPDVARQLEIPGIAIVPYYYYDQKTGRAYEDLMRTVFDCEPVSWKGFHHETSGIDTGLFTCKLKEFKDNLREIKLVPYMDFSSLNYVRWFTSCDTVVGGTSCLNPWKLLDIQPNGHANFCVDLPDYILGNIDRSTIKEVWNSKRANRFREYRKDHVLPVCLRCGARYMSK